MIRQIGPDAYAGIDRQLQKENARSYFIRLGLKKPGTFRDIYGDYAPDGALRALYCLRQSGTLQFIALTAPDSRAAAALMAQLPWCQLIAPASSAQHLMKLGLLGVTELRASIAALEVPQTGQEGMTRPMTLQDLPEVNSLYDRVFEHHMSLAQMQEKLAAGRGRGVVLCRDHRIVAVAQTEFEEQDSALVVGVATDPDHRRQGLATRCVENLCAVLQQEGRKPWLQYDNPSAGQLYRQMGFVEADRVLFGWPIGNTDQEVTG